MKKNVQKQPRNVTTRIDRTLLKKVQNKAEKEQRPQVVVLNRLVNSGLSIEQMREANNG